MIERIRRQAGALKRELVALYLACRDRRTPLYAKLFAGAVLAYALSPIDLIPDFIPILGYLDDFILLPAGIWVAIRLIPPEVMAESRERAVLLERLPQSVLGTIIIVMLWCVAAALVLTWLLNQFSG